MTTQAIPPLRQRMIEGMNARKVGPHSQRATFTAASALRRF
jgi:hypothetical protein